MRPMSSRVSPAEVVNSETLCARAPLLRPAIYSVTLFVVYYVIHYVVMFD